LLTGIPSSVARAMKTISAHSPRSFLSVIFGFRFFIDRPQNEKGGIRGKTRECRPMFLFDRNKKPKARKS
jgi:hypothetical protein